jgi:hypothetical protein
LAVANYADQNGHLPPAYQLGPDGRPWHSWRVLILPFIEGHEVFTQYRFDEPWDGPNNRMLAPRIPRTYTFHNRDVATTTANYLAVVGSKTIWPGATGLKWSEIKDGPGNTILLVENDGLDVHWMEPRDMTFNDMSFELQQPNGVSSPYRVPGVAMADGSVRSLNPDLTPDELRAMLTVNGGEHLTDAESARAPVIDDGRNRELRDK